MEDNAPLRVSLQRFGVLLLMALVVSFLWTLHNTHREIWNKTLASVAASRRTIESDIHALSLVSRLGTLPAALAFNTPEAAEGLVNQSIYGQPHWLAVFVLDATGHPFARNTVSDEGVFLNYTDPVLNRDWRSLRLRPATLPKSGSIDYLSGPLNERPVLFLSRPVVQQELIVGRLLVLVALDRLLHTHLLEQGIAGFVNIRPEGLPVTLFQDATLTVGVRREAVWNETAADFFPGFVAVALIFTVGFLIYEFMARLLQTQKVARQAQERLAAEVAHDIASPLTVLTLVGQKLENITASERLLLNQATRRVREIVTGLTKKAPHLPSPVALARSSTSLGHLCEQIVEEKRLEFQGRPELEILWDVDPAASQIAGAASAVPEIELLRVLSNLVNNAVEAVGQSGVVRLFLERRDAAGPGSWATVLVQDSGPGIPPGVWSQLSRFGASFGKPGGSGIGLWQARRKVEQWRGTLEIRSTPGRGTTIAIGLPMVGLGEERRNPVDTEGTAT